MTISNWGHGAKKMRRLPLRTWIFSQMPGVLCEASLLPDGMFALFFVPFVTQLDLSVLWVQPR